jgi:cytochrome P450
VVLADIEVGGQIIRADEGLVLPNDIANRDPAAFPDPDLLDIQRSARVAVPSGSRCRPRPGKRSPPG